MKVLDIWGRPLSATYGQWPFAMPHTKIFYARADWETILSNIMRFPARGWKPTGYLRHVMTKFAFFLLYQPKLADDFYQLRYAPSKEVLQ